VKDRDFGIPRTASGLDKLVQKKAENNLPPLESEGRVEEAQEAQCKPSGSERKNVMGSTRGRCQQKRPFLNDPWRGGKRNPNGLEKKFWSAR